MTTSKNIILESASCERYTFTEKLYIQNEDVDKISEEFRCTDNITEKISYMIPDDIDAYIIKEHAFYHLGTWCSVISVMNGIAVQIYKRFFPFYGKSLSLEEYSSFLNYIDPIVHKYKCV